jgi:hypothetical protein
MALQKQPSKTPAAPSYISLSPDDATQGGLIDDIDVVIIDAATCEWDYNGQAAAGPALAVQFEDRNHVTHDQYYSAGRAEDWAPTPDGCGFQAVSGKTGFNNSTNLMKFFDSLAKEGFPKDLLAAGNVKAIIGTDCHVLQVEQDRKGLVRTGKNADRKSTTLLVSKIHSLPGTDNKKPASATAPAGKSTAAVGGKANGAAKATKSTASDEYAEIDPKLIEGLTESLADNGVVPLKDVMKIAVSQFKGTAHNSAAIKRSRDMAFLDQFKGDGYEGIKFDGAEFSLA